MDMSTVLKELGRIKRNCSNISFEDCMNGCCPYHGRPACEDKTIYCCLFDDLGMNQPCDWQLPEEI